MSSKNKRSKTTEVSGSPSIESKDLAKRRRKKKEHCIEESQGRKMKIDMKEKIEMGTFWKS